MAMNATAILLYTRQPLGRAHDIRYPNPEVFVDDHNLALGYQLAVDEQVNRLAGQLVKLYDRSLAETQYVLHELSGAPAPLSASWGRRVSGICFLRRWEGFPRPAAGI